MRLGKWSEEIVETSPSRIEISIVFLRLVLLGVVAGVSQGCRAVGSSDVTLTLSMCACFFWLARNEKGLIKDRTLRKIGRVTEDKSNEDDDCRIRGLLV